MQTTNLVNTLNERSMENMIHPLKDIDWSTPIDAQQYFIDPSLSFLSGTKEFDELPDEDKIKATLGDVMNLFAVGLWAEQVLIHGYVRSIFRLSADSPDFRYRLHEMEEEIHHNMMFSEFLKKAGYGSHKVKKSALFWGWFFRHMSAYHPDLFMLAILAGEETTDIIAKESLKRTDLNPLSSRIMEVHREDESRHRAYARSQIKYSFNKLSFIRKTHIRMILPLITKLVVQQFVRPEIYIKLGIKNADLLIQKAKENNIIKKRQQFVCQKYINLLKNVGVIKKRHLFIWKALGLV